MTSAEISNCRSCGRERPFGCRTRRRREAYGAFSGGSSRRTTTTGSCRRGISRRCGADASRNSGIAAVPGPVPSALRGAEVLLVLENLPAAPENAHQLETWMSDRNADLRSALASKTDPAIISQLADMLSRSDQIGPVRKTRTSRNGEEERSFCTFLNHTAAIGRKFGEARSRWGQHWRSQGTPPTCSHNCKIPFARRASWGGAEPRSPSSQAGSPQ